MVPITQKGSPTGRAAVSAGIYMVLCGIYIILSGQWAAEASETAAQLQRIETLKGIGFILVTGLLFFVISLIRWKRIASQQKKINEQDRILRLTERREVAALCSAIIAHDLNNLLMGLTGLVEDLKASAISKSCGMETIRELENCTANLSLLARRVTSASREVIPETSSSVNLSSSISRLICLVGRHPDLRTCRFIAGTLVDKALMLNEILFEEAVLNLLINAGQSAGPGGRVEIRARETDRSVLVEVHDDGPGVPEEIVGSIFSVCFTTRHGGTGLGLLAVKAFADSCGGSVDVGASPMGGALFTLEIPTDEKTGGQQ